MHLKSKLLILFLGIVGFLFQSCTDERSDDPEGTARVQVKLVDAPGDYDQVMVNIIDVRYNISDEDNEEDGEEENEGGWKSFDSFTEPVMVDLTELTAGNSLLLADEILPAGYLSQIRLVLGDGNYIVIKDENDQPGPNTPLETPSAQQSGLKLNVQTELEGGFSYNFVLDWDVQKSIVETGNGKYQLKPVIRTNLEVNSGILTGYVEGDSTDDDMDNPTLIEGAMVYLFSPEVTEENWTIENSYANTETGMGDDAGKFWFEGLEPGKYRIVIPAYEVSAEFTFDPFASAPDVEITAGVINEFGTITLMPPTEE